MIFIEMNSSPKPNFVKQLAAEAIGTALLLAAIVGSGIMGERLSGGNVAITLLANTISTGATLVALILAFGPISGAHFNPAVTVCDALRGNFLWSRVPGFVLAQFLGAMIGVAIANAMFELPPFMLSERVRTGPSQWLSECVATFGLLFVIWGVSHSQKNLVPFAVGAYITGAYWFTSSTSFANPAVTFARSFSNTFAGIKLTNTPIFMVVQFVGAIAATILFKWISKISR